VAEVDHTSPRREALESAGEAGRLVADLGPAQAWVRTRISSRIFEPVGLAPRSRTERRTSKQPAPRVADARRRRGNGPAAETRSLREMTSRAARGRARRRRSVFRGTDDVGRRRLACGERGRQEIGRCWRSAS